MFTTGLFGAGINFQISRLKFHYCTVVFFALLLNFVYGRTRKSDPELGEVILLLSKMMRYAVISEFDTGKVSVAKEMEQVNNLIGLWKISRTDSSYI
ncbi:MAG: histidine kinase [Pedobacter sp.]|nr:MAG: histidine kinase [Pedobacter sp.]